MNESIEDVLTRYAAKCGWDERKQLRLVLDFLRDQYPEVLEELDAWLGDVVQDDAGNSSE